MALNVEVDILARMPIFQGIEQGKLKLIAFAGQRISCNVGETLFRQNEYSDSVYIILDGSVNVFREDGDKRTLLAEIGSGQIFGEIGVLCNRPRTATIVSATELTVLRLPSDVFIEFVRELPQFAMAMINELSRRLDAMNKQLSAARS